MVFLKDHTQGILLRTARWLKPSGRVRFFFSSQGLVSLSFKHLLSHNLKSSRFISCKTMHFFCAYASQVVYMFVSNFRVFYWHTIDWHLEKRYRVKRTNKSLKQKHVKSNSNLSKSRTSIHSWKTTMSRL